jgi:hypothetical protein
MGVGYVGYVEGRSYVWKKELVELWVGQKPIKRQWQLMKMIWFLPNDLEIIWLFIDNSICEVLM